MSEQELSTAAIDRFRSLPDDILIHILSSVPTKQAVATSILSKRWIHLWRYVPDVKFIESKLEHASCFNEFVCTVLRSRVAAGNHSINSFILDVKYVSSELLLCSLDNIDKWVGDVVKRNVQCLNLCHHAPADWNGIIPPKLPTSIVTCTTLVVLKLYGFSFMGASSLLNFPSLKTLHLEAIYFDRRDEFTLLLDGCPVLEDLQASIIVYNGLSSHCHKQVSRSSLRRLNRADITICECYFLVESLSNLEFLRIQLLKDYPYYYDFPTFDPNLFQVAFH